MLYRAAVQDVKSGRISRRYGHLVVVMQHYPRFLRSELVDEYLRELAPERGLFSEFKAKDRELKDHEVAFDQVSYEKRFWLSPKGWEELERLSGMARERDIFLICQCRPLERCHGDLLLLAARQRFGALTQFPRKAYPEFERRLSETPAAE